jgi:hypothetical protein
MIFFGQAFIPVIAFTIVVRLLTNDAILNKQVKLYFTAWSRKYTEYKNVRVMKRTHASVLFISVWIIYFNVCGIVLLVFVFYIIADVNLLYNCPVRLMNKIKYYIIVHTYLSIIIINMSKVKTFVFFILRVPLSPKQEPTLHCAWDSYLLRLYWIR